MRLTAEVVGRARQRLLRMHYEAGAGHLGGNLSCLEALLCLYHEVLRPEDQFVLSKGHSAGAHYVALWSVGLLEEETLSSFGRDGSPLPFHPPSSGLPQAPFGSGSLGHGLSLAAGLALGRKLSHAPGRVYCLTSDGEWQEGQIWEALIFAQQHRLDNLCLLVDQNGWQGLDRVNDVESLSLDSRLQAFGVRVCQVDGHDVQAVSQALGGCREQPGSGPAALLLKTVKGRGIPGWEDQLHSHYARLETLETVSE